MTTTLIVPLVAGRAYRERLEQLPAAFQASLETEPHNAYNPHAVAVIAPNGKIGYVAPECARDLYERVAGGEQLPCLVRRGDHGPTTGVFAVLDVAG